MLGLITVMLITPDVFVGGFPAVPPKSIKNPAEKAEKMVVALFAQAKILTFCLPALCLYLHCCRYYKTGIVCKKK